MKRYLVLLAAILMQACFGGIYAWSNLVEPLREQYGFTTLHTQFIFGTVLMALTGTMIVSGRLQDRHHPRPVALTGGVLYLAGFLTASVAGERFLLLWLGAGLLTGIAIGCGYVCAVATSVKWFAHRKGLATGIVVGAYGCGAIFMSLVSEAMLDDGWSVAEVFRGIGLVYGTLIIAASLLLFVPPKEAGGRDGTGAAGVSDVPADRAAGVPPDVPVRRVVRDRRCIAVFIVFLCGNLPGLMVIGNLRPMAEQAGASPAWALAAISILAVANTSGRVLWGLAFDQFGYRRMVLTSMAIVIGSMLLMLLTAGGVGGVGGTWLLAVAVILVGLGFSSCLVLHPAHIAGRFGPARFGSVYPWIGLAHGLGAILGGPLGGVTADLAGGYASAYVAGAVLAGIGLALFLKLFDEPV